MEKNFFDCEGQFITFDCREVGVRVSLELCSIVVMVVAELRRDSSAPPDSRGRLSLHEFWCREKAGPLRQAQGRLSTSQDHRFANDFASVGMTGCYWVYFAAVASSATAFLK
jgi:hypothetical protein